MKCEYRVVTEEDISYLAKNARKLDIQEISEMSTLSMEQVITESVKSSSLCASAYVDGELNAILGVCPASDSILNTIGVPWMIGTDAVNKNRKVFCNEYGKIINQMLSEFSLLQNYVDSRNYPAIRFLTKAGFELEEAKPFGLNGVPFHKFYKRA